MLTGRTVHVGPSLGGNWQVVDLDRHVTTFPNKSSAVEGAKTVAQSNQPSQVVLFDQRGQPIHVAHYQLPQYRWDTDGGSSDSGLIGAAAKSLVIGRLVAAGAAFPPELIDSLDRDLRKETGKAKSSARRKRNSSS